MNLDYIMQMFKEEEDIEFVRFVSDKGPNSCEACLANHGKIYQTDDLKKPALPIHPNCRCKYVKITAEESIEFQKKRTNQSLHFFSDETTRPSGIAQKQGGMTHGNTPSDGKFNSVTVRVDKSPGLGGIRISGIDDMLDKLEKNYPAGSISELIISNHGGLPGYFPMGNSDDLIFISASQIKRLKRLLSPGAIIDIRMCYSSEGSEGNKAAQNLANKLGCMVRGYEGPVSPLGTRPRVVKPDSFHPRKFWQRFFPDHKPHIFYPQKNLK